MQTPVPTDATAGYSPWRAAKFYVPLVIQAASQSLTYPLVASIVSHGKNGVVDLAAFAQGQAVMFMIGALGGGLLTTGMVFGRDAEGSAVQAAEPVDVRGAGRAAGARLPAPLRQARVPQAAGPVAPMDETAREVLFLSIPLQIFFFLRNPAARGALQRPARARPPTGPRSAASR
jgi:hypothetical protein